MQLYVVIAGRFTNMKIHTFVKTFIHVHINIHQKRRYWQQRNQSQMH